MPKVIETHINAYYAELAEAKKAKLVADKRVTELEEVIVGRGHPLPEADGSFADPAAEDVAHSNDVSAAEATDAKKGKK